MVAPQIAPLIKDLPESVRSNTVNHTQDATIRMDEWLDTYERHIPEHLEKMQGNLDDWVKQGKTIRELLRNHHGAAENWGTEDQVGTA